MITCRKSFFLFKAINIYFLQTKCDSKNSKPKHCLPTCSIDLYQLAKWALLIRK